jgi:hypothetical protein
MNINPYGHKVNIDPEIKAINDKRIFLFADARSGSTWLINTLNAHPEISMVDEILNPDFIKNFPSNRKNADVANLKGNAVFIESHLNHLPGKFAGCKILFPQAIRYLDIYEFLLNYRESRFILLYRKNIVQAEISGLIANKYHRWHLIEHKEKQTVTVDPGFLHDRMIWRLSAREFCISLIKFYCRHALVIEYEELFTNIDGNLKAISEFMEVPVAGFKHGTEVKSNPFPLNELIENFSDCRAAFINHPELYQMFSE